MQMIMKAKTLIIVVLLQLSIEMSGQSVIYTPKGQAMPSKVQCFDRESFSDCDNTQIRWLGNAGFLINSRGTTLMVDPLLQGFDMPLLIDMPIKTESVPHLDAILITHSDNDHYSIPTCMDLSAVCKEYHSTMYVDTLMKSQNLNSVGHKIGDTFFVKQMKVTLTPADHLWQNELLKDSRKFMLEDCCGFWIETPDGVIWAPGDTRLMPQLLEMNAPDAIFFDFSDDSWHFGLDNAIKIANVYPNAQLLLSHWGSVDAPDMAVFNADPKLLYDKVVNPQRIRLLQPGELFILTITVTEHAVENHAGIIGHDRIMISMRKSHHSNKTVRDIQKFSINIVDEVMLPRADYAGTVSGANENKSKLFEYTIGNEGTPVINDSPLTMECVVEDIYETKTFDNFICKIANTYDKEEILGESVKIDYGSLKPILFEMPNYQYLRTGEVVGKYRTLDNNIKQE